jgi:type I restriction enzyme R subunit
MDDPALTGRTNFKDFIAETTLRERLRATNLSPDGKPSPL